MGALAAKYRGFCLEFCTDYDPFKKSRMVKCVDRIPTINLEGLYIRREPEQIIDLYCTKSRVWEYEREWRSIHMQAGTLFQYPLEALKAVYLGPNIDPDAQKKVLLAVASEKPGAERWQGRKSEVEFKIEFERLP